MDSRELRSLEEEEVFYLQRSRNELPWGVYSTIDPNKAISFHASLDVAVIALEKAKWRPIETAPKDGNSVLLLFQCDGEEPFVDKAYWDDVHMPTGDGSVIRKAPRNEWVLDQEGPGEYSRPQWGYTHWKPLPKPLLLQANEMSGS